MEINEEEFNKKLAGFDSYWEVCNKVGKARAWSMSFDDICEEIDKIVNEKFKQE